MILRTCLFTNPITLPCSFHEVVFAPVIPTASAWAIVGWVYHGRVPKQMRDYHLSVRALLYKRMGFSVFRIESPKFIFLEILLSSSNVILITMMKSAPPVAVSTGDTVLWDVIEALPPQHW